MSWNSNVPYVFCFFFWFSQRQLSATFFPASTVSNVNVFPSVTRYIMKGQQAFGEVTHALMRKHNPYRPGHPAPHHGCYMSSR